MLDKYVSKKNDFHITYQTSDVIQNKTKILRKKCIIIEESIKNGSLYKRSDLLTCRNPFKPDENIINYDMDTEDEWAEENGESLREDGANKSDEEDDDFDDDEDQQGFIVDDDYLSVSEMNYSNMELNQNEIQEDIARRKAILQKNRESKEALKKENLNQGPQIMLYKNCDFS